VTEPKPTVVQDVIQKPSTPLAVARGSAATGDGRPDDSQPIEPPPPGGGQVKGEQGDL